MTFEQARNAIISALESYIGCPVNLSEQIENIPNFPYCYYSVLVPRISNHLFGLREVISTGEKTVLMRSEPVMATMSFTFCSKNRENDNSYILGENEALELSEKAHGFFLLNAHSISTEYGEIIINNVGTVSNRTSLFVEDYIRRYGFDIRFSYIRSDEMQTITVLNPGKPIRNTYS